MHHPNWLVRSPNLYASLFYVLSTSPMLMTTFLLACKLQRLVMLSHSTVHFCLSLILRLNAARREVGAIAF